MKLEASMIRKTSRPIFLMPLIALLFLAGATSSEPFVQTTDLDYKSILPPPPALDSDQFRREVDQMLQWQAERTDADVKRIKAEVKWTPFIFSQVLGPSFNPDDLPYTAKFLKRVMENAGNIDRAAKLVFNRPRPFLMDSRIHPCVAKEKSFSYPSGHSTQSLVVALTIAQLFPQHKDALIARAWKIGSDRTLGGEHFPSDIVGGRILARAIFARMQKNPDFQAELQKAQAECRAIQPAK
jgi:acid phosphatase (class A)